MQRFVLLEKTQGAGNWQMVGLRKRQLKEFHGSGWELSERVGSLFVLGHALGGALPMMSGHRQSEHIQVETLPPGDG